MKNKDTQKKGLVRIGVFLGVVFLVMLSLMIRGCDVVMAAGGWIGSGGTIGGVDNPGSGSGSSCNNSTNKYQEDCAGVSWIYYEAQEETEEGIQFPYIPKSLNVTIPATCSKTVSGKKGGFWHYGINLFGTNLAGGTNSAYNTWNKYLEVRNNNGDISSLYGHWKTLQWGETFGWNSYPLYEVGNLYQTRSDSLLNQKLYDSSETAIYEAVRYGLVSGVSSSNIDDEHNVRKAYGEACNLADNCQVTLGSDGLPIIPSDVWGFCWWPEVDSSAFEGIASAGGSGVNVTTDWQSTNTYRSQTIECADSDGCEVTFTLGMRRKTGEGETTYWYESGNSRGSVTEISGTRTTGYATSRSFTSKIRQGQTVCYDIAFSPSGNTSIAREKICVTAAATPPPDNNSSCPGSGLLDMYVKNNNVANAWVKQEYAKPGDTLTYCTYYDPSTYQGSMGWQYTSYDCAGSCTNFTQPLGSALSLTNKIEIKRNVKRNSDTFTGASFGGTTLSIKDYGGGNTALQTEENTYSVKMSNTGDVIDEQTNTTGNTPTGKAYTTWTSNPRSFSTCGYDPYDCDPYDCNPYDCNEHDCCEPCECTTDEDGVETCEDTCCETCYDTCYETCYNTCWEHYEVGHISTVTAYSPIAHGHVPYNFINSTQVTSPTQNKIVYAGESQPIDISITTSPKYNATTQGTYATQVHGARWKLQLCYNGGCYDTNEVTENLNMSESSINGSTASREYTVTIPDLPAGSTVCATSWIYPATSGADTNWQDSDGDHQWAVSGQVCYIVAKRPSLQAWGGNVYANANIVTSLSNKFHVSGYTGYDVNNSNYGGRRVIFGSWGELGMIGNGVFVNMASGAAMGYNYSTGVVSGNNVCSRVPLTFANALLTGTCSGSFGGLNKVSATNNKLDAATVVDKYIYDGDDTYTSANLNSFRNDTTSAGNIYKDNNVYYYKNINSGVSELSVSGVIPVATTQVVHANTIRVNGNLVYGSDGETFTNFSSLPKLILYAETEVKINCDVARIDAVIVSPKVTTCADGKLGESYNNDGTMITLISDTPNTNQKSQLKVNGTVITKWLIANRTYGAGPGVASESATGVNSITPAEILNYDPTLYLWEVNTGNSASANDVTASTDLTTTYIKELAPRY